MRIVQYNLVFSHPSSQIPLTPIQKHDSETMPPHITNYNPPPLPETETRYSTAYLTTLCTDVRKHVLESRYPHKDISDTLSPIETNPLFGYCYESARELSFALTESDIPHRVVKGGIKPLLTQSDTIDPPYTMDDIEAIGARHYWLEIDHPTTNTTWVLELCSEKYDTNYGDIFVDTIPHDCLVRLADHTHREPWTNNDPEWWWHTQNLETIPQSSR